MQEFQLLIYIPCIQDNRQIPHEEFQDRAKVEIVKNKGEVPVLLRGQHKRMNTACKEKELI